MYEVRGDTAERCNPRRRLDTDGLALLTSLVYEVRLIELLSESPVTQLNSITRKEQPPSGCSLVCCRLQRAWIHVSKQYVCTNVPHRAESRGNFCSEGPILRLRRDLSPSLSAAGLYIVGPAQAQRAEKFLASATGAQVEPLTSFTVGTTASSGGAGERLQVSVWRRGQERSRGLGDSNRRPDIASRRRCPFIPGAASRPPSSGEENTGWARAIVSKRREPKRSRLPSANTGRRHTFALIQMLDYRT